MSPDTLAHLNKIFFFQYHLKKLVIDRFSLYNVAPIYKYKCAKINFKNGVTKLPKNRLFQIVYYILEKQKVTAPELAKKFEVSQRTIYRDIDTISNAGIPIYTTRGKDGGISILDTFVLKKAFFSKSEQKLMLDALQGLSFIDQKETSKLLTKFCSIFQIKEDNWIEVDFSSWKSNQPTEKQFNRIKDAILNRNVISFQYINNSGKRTKRNLNPDKLIFKSGNWYVHGFCHLRKEYRLFKLTRIRDLKVLNHNFHWKKLSAKIIHETDKTDLVQVKLKFNKTIAARVYDEFSEDIELDAQGNLYLTTNLPNNDTLYSYILSFANNVEVISPLPVRKQIADKIAKIQEIYKT